MLWTTQLRVDNDKRIMQENNSKQGEGKFEIKDDIIYKYSSNWIHDLESELHWSSYRTQQKIMRPYLKKGDALMEIGPGNGFCSNYLRSKGIEVTTFDIDKDKNPDIQGNIVDYIPPEKYKHIAAFEIFEHIPYDKFLGVLSNLKNHCDGIFFSLPLYKVSVFDLRFVVPKYKELHWKLFMPKKKMSAHHFWEVGYKKHTKKRLIQDVTEAGYTIDSMLELDTFLFFRICPNT